MFATKISLPILFLLSIFACGQSTSSRPISAEQQTTFLIPEVGLEVQSDAYPELNKSIHPAYQKYFSVAHAYEFFRQYHLDTIPFGVRVAVYYNPNVEDTTTILENGVQALREMMTPGKTGTKLLDEKTQFLGRPAQRMIFYLDDENALRASIILVAIGPYFVELCVFDPVGRGVVEKDWKEQPFFQTVSLKGTVPLQVLRRVHEESENCLLMPCYFKEEQMIAYFPSAPLVMHSEPKPGLKATKYHVVPVDEKERTLTYGLEFYEGNTSVGSIPDSTYVNMLVTSGNLLSPFHDDEKLVSSEKIQFQGKFAMDARSIASVPLGSGNGRNIGIHSRTFVHQGRVVRMFTYRDAGMLENYPAICFFDWMVFL